MHENRPRGELGLTGSWVKLSMLRLQFQGLTLSPPLHSELLLLAEPTNGGYFFNALSFFVPLMVVPLGLRCDVIKMDQGSCQGRKVWHPEITCFVASRFAEVYNSWAVSCFLNSGQ